MKLTLVLAFLTTSGVSGCFGSRPGGDALADAMEQPLRVCAGTLAGDSIEAARAGCLPPIEIYRAVTGR